MARVKRNLRSQKVIRELFEEQGIKYVMINNKIIDVLYKQGYYEYKVKATNEAGLYCETGEVKKLKFDARNLVLYIGLKFLDRLEFSCYNDEIADFVNMSTKRIKDRLEELQDILLPMNNRLTKNGQNELLKEPEFFQLVKKHRDRGFERNREVKTYRWYTPFDCDRKEIVNPETKEKELKAHSFFMVTIYDFDLYLNGILDEHEFALYLYLIKCFDSNNKENKGIAQSKSKISENVLVKDVKVTERRLDKLVNLRVKDKYCLEDEDFPLIHTIKPKNYNLKLTTRQEPSLHYYTVYNDTNIQKINDQVPVPYPDVDEHDSSNLGELEQENNLNQKEDTDLNKTDIEFKIDTDFDNLDTNNDLLDIDALFKDTHPF
ncbi:hypothetical protein ABET51_06645 [Metabacillus fastidiosus]|uniref:hypothetical protein n=1 Tax=Metabacillus fastidiosus TaxID=1458 RepID=UPI003D2D693C